MGNLGFNIVDLAGAHTAHGVTTFSKDALSKVPKGTTLDINLKKGKHIVVSHQDINAAVCIGACPPSKGPTTPAKTGNGTVTNPKTHVTKKIVPKKTPVVTPPSGGTTTLEIVTYNG